MTIERGTKKFCDHFDRAQELSTTPGHNGWTVKDTSAAGTPTYLINDKGLTITLANDSEIEVATAYFNDVLSDRLEDIARVDMTVEVANINAITTLVFGVASAQDDTPDDVAVHAWFRMQGSASTTAIVAETDDGTNDANDIATGETLAAVLKRCVIDLNNLSDVKFYVDGERVAESQTFNLSGITSGQKVQPFVQIQKTAGAGTPAVSIRKFQIDSSYEYGA